MQYILFYHLFLTQNYKNLNFQIDNNSILFNLSDYNQYLFKIIYNSTYGEGELINFCNKNICKIPIIFYGEQTLLILTKNKKILNNYTFNSLYGRWNCIGSNWKNRICRFNNICFENNNLTFYSPYNIITEKPFLILGSRSPPYDKKRDRIYNITIHNHLNLNKKNLNLTYIYSSPYYNNHMLWHFLFDFTLPLFYTKFSFNLNKFNLLLPFNSDQNFPNNILNSFVNDIEKVTNNYCYNDLIVGIIKNKDKNGIEYLFPKNFTHLLIPYLKNFNNIKNEEINNNNKIKIILINKNNRKILNSNEIINLIKNNFNNIIINEIYFEELNFKEQIEIVLNTNILIGMHGSFL